MCAECEGFDVEYKKLIQLIFNHLEDFFKKNLFLVETYSIFVRINYRKTIFSTIYQKNLEIGFNN